MSEKRRCDACIYYQPCPFWSEGICDNPQSVKYQHYTNDGESCQSWEEWHA